MDPAQARSLQSALDTEVNNMKTVQEQISKLIPVRQKLLTQLNENTMVKKELDILKDDDAVYKLTGPVLIKSDTSEAQQNVANRIKYFKAEIERVDVQEKEMLERRQKQQDKIQAIQNSARQAYQAAVQKATQQQTANA